MRFLTALLLAAAAPALAQQVPPPPPVPDRAAQPTAPEPAQPGPAAVASPAPGITPYEPLDLYRIAAASAPRVSPDGRQLLYTRSFFDIATDRRQNELWLATLDSAGRLADRRLLVGASAGATAYRWSPDGRRIAFVAQAIGKPQIHVLTLADGIARQLGAVPSGASQLAWSPDGAALAFTALVERPAPTLPGMPAKPEGATWAPAPRIIDDLTYRRDGEGYVKPGATHLFTIALEGGRVTQLTSGPRNGVSPDSALAWTRDGRAIIAAAPTAPRPEAAPWDVDLFRFDARTSNAAPQRLTSAPGAEGDPVLSPDGATLVFTASGLNQSFWAMPRLWAMPAAGGAPRQLAAALDRPVSQVAWNGAQLLALYNDEGQQRIAAVPLDGGPARVRVAATGNTSLIAPSASGTFDAAGGTIAYLAPFADRPSGVAALRAGRASTIDLNAEWAATKSPTRLEEVNATAPDGKRVQGWLLFPPNFDPAKKYPLILQIHGGPNSDYGPYWSQLTAHYASRGYLVLFTNPRGSIGYGDAFANAITGAYPGDDHGDLMAATDLVAKRAYVDADNLFITGGSGGGVLTLWGIAKEPKKFRAAAALRPVTDWSLQTLTSDIGPITWRFWLDNKYPWDDPAYYLKRSPVSLVGQITTPTLLMTGEQDYRTPIAQTEQIFGALQLRGVPTRMVRLPEASHSMGRPSQWIAANLAVLDWFERYRAK